LRLASCDGMCPSRVLGGEGVRHFAHANAVSGVALLPKCLDLQDDGRSQPYGVAQRLDDVVVMEFR
jgi:hypothetical protein